MSGGREQPPIRWRLHLASSPAAVHGMLSTDEGRARFWAESADERDGWIYWRWPGAMEARTRVLASEAPALFTVEYFARSIATFELADDGSGGTDLTLTDEGVPPEDWAETHAGWVSVLMALKAAVDHGIDLRNHDPDRTWEQGYADN
ncbi:MAG TPA: SRPBCC domain-containing protein [Candidatus Limnocylindria bacterium]|nr:SRPBCC domain-containing protein [Candidatus Limnocylindria bacterium]